MPPVLGLLAACLMSAAVLAPFQIAVANEAKPFLVGKQITFFVGTSAGGGYDLCARTLAQFMPAHIPGNPKIIVQDRPESSGLGLANTV